MREYRHYIVLFALAVGTFTVVRFVSRPEPIETQASAPSEAAGTEPDAVAAGTAAPVLTAGSSTAAPPALKTLPAVTAASRFIDIDQLDPAKVLDQRLTDLGNGRFERLTLVNGGGSYPYHRIEEKLKYDEASGTYTVVSQFMAVADQLLVKLSKGSGADELEELNSRFGTSTLESMGFARRYIIQLPELSLDALDEYTAMFEGETQYIDRVNLNGIRGTSAVPNDTYYSLQWDKQIVDCETAWDTETGSTDIIVAVIDTGVDLDHVDLEDHIWHNPGEAGALASNGIDDDGNGYVDDWIGYDFGQDDNDPDDNGDGYTGASGYGHGTHCAGIIGTVGNNNQGIAGICWNVTIMALKPFEYFGTYEGVTYNAMLVYDSKAAEAMVYAADNGAKVTSNSYGGTGGDAGFYEDGAYYLLTNDVLFITAAGNGGDDGIGDDNDVTPHWPSNLDLENVISVGSSDSSDAVSSFSNYGETSVDLFAPGSSIPSTYPDDQYVYLSGTSMACPQVAGAAALLYSYNPDLSWEECKAALIDSVDTSATFTNICVSHGRMNVAAAMVLIQLDDADGDNLPDDWEEYYYGNTAAVDADDTAANGINTIWEAYVAGISPTDSSARFEIESIESDSVLGKHVLEWTEADERLYTVYWTPNLQITDFTAIASNYSGGAYTDLIHGTESIGFYRLGVDLDTEVDE